MKTVILGGGVQVSTPFLTPEEAAVYVGVSLRTLRRMGLRGHVVGGQVRYDARELDEAIKNKEA
jgi:excisionase family DNA binding protein